MTLHFLWTDQCFLFVVAIGILCLIRGVFKPRVRGAFLAVLRQPIAASSAIILLFFLMIGVMDSIHVTTQTASGSLLDHVLSPLGDVYEKTYSKPFALTLYSSETVLAHNHVLQDYPRLTYPPKTLYNEESKRDVIHRILSKAGLIGFFVVMMLWLSLVVIRQLQLGRVRLTLEHSELSVLMTLFVVIVMVLSCYWLSRDFHILGTGKIGQDIFYYTVKSIRTGLVIGLLTTLFMMPLALFFGLSAGYFGGLVDDVIQYIYTLLSSIPGVLLITASVLSMQTYIANHPKQFTTLTETADARLFALCLILGVTSWTSLCRLLRAEALKLRNLDFILAAKALGSGSFRIIYKHILPNVMHIVVMTVILDFSFLVLAEAVLSYVGVGVSPMTISWGNMINAARLELAREPIVWWPVASAFFFMFVLVLASNLFADAVRDALDPHRTIFNRKVWKKCG